MGAPLYEAATKKVPGRAFIDIWKERNLQEHFDRAKRMIMLATQIAHPDPNLPISLTTDASKVGMAGCLAQFSNNTWHPLGFWSKKFKPNETNWSTFRRELLAVKEAIRHFIPEIDGKELIVFTDHLPLLGAFKSQNSLRHDPIAYNHLLEISNWTSTIKH